MKHHLLKILKKTSGGHQIFCEEISDDVRNHYKYVDDRTYKGLIIDEEKKCLIESIISLPYYYTSNFTIQDIFIELGIEEWLI